MRKVLSHPMYLVACIVLTHFCGFLTSADLWFDHVSESYWLQSFRVGLDHRSIKLHSRPRLPPTCERYDGPTLDVPGNLCIHTVIGWDT